MGSTELAANLFRATQTEEKLRKEKIQGKDAANRTHREVGARVRQAIKDIGGTMPEDLPTVDSIKKLFPISLLSIYTQPLLSILSLTWLF